MAQNQIEHPFEIKRDASGNLIPPDFLDNDVIGPVVPTIDQVTTGSVEVRSVEPIDTHAEENAESVEDPLEQPQNESQIEAPAKKSHPPREHNLRRLREELDKERQEREIMARELEIYRRTQGNNQYTAQPQYQNQQQQQEANIPELSIGDDDLVEGKHLKQYVQQMQKQLRETNQQYANQAAQAHQASLEAQIKLQYPDFDQVVNQGNLKDLAAAYPELAATIHSATDLRSQAITAYTMIKNLGIDQSQAQEDIYMANKERIKRNAAKPRPASSAATTQASPLSNAAAFSGGLTGDLKKQLIEEMQRFRQG